jgi:hypothetical protein
MVDRAWNVLMMGAVLVVASALPGLADSLPAAVKSEIATDVAACKSSDGTPSSAARAVKTGDANKDGQPDYLLDEGRLCEVGFCGSGGCSFVLFLSGPDGVKKAYSGLGASPKLGKGFLSYVGASGRAKVKVSGYIATE